MKIGYARVSTADQSLARQIEALQAAGCSRIFEEKLSGATADRPQLAAMLDYIRDEDTVVITSFDRLARSTRDLLRTLDRIREKGASFQSIAENVDTDTAQGRFMVTVFAALSELERESIRQRQREGVELAKREGRYKGRQPIRLDESRFRAEVARWQSGEQTLHDTLRHLEISKSTLYRRCRERGLLKAAPGREQNTSH